MAVAARHLRANAIAYVALFVALGGTAWAANKIGSGDIERDAVRSKHIGPGQVKNADTNRKSLGKAFGTGLLGGEVQGFDSGGGNLSAAISVFGRTDLPGPRLQILIPKPVTLRDLRVSIFSNFVQPIPATQTLTLRLEEGSGGATLECTIQGGNRSCSSGTDKLRLQAGDELKAEISSLGTGPLPAKTYLFGYRAAP